MKRSLVLVVLMMVVSVGACSQSPTPAESPVERLSIVETCTEVEAILALENDDVVKDGAADQVGEQMDILAKKASTIISDDIKLTADMSNGVYGNAGQVRADKSLSEKYSAALARIGRVCDIGWLEGS